MLCLLFLYSLLFFIHHFFFAHTFPLMPILTVNQVLCIPRVSAWVTVCWLMMTWMEFCAGWWATLCAIRQALTNGKLLLLLLLVSVVVIIVGVRGKQWYMHTHICTPNINTMCAKKSEWQNVWKMVKTEAPPSLCFFPSHTVSTCLVSGAMCRCCWPAAPAAVPVRRKKFIQNIQKNKTKSNKLQVRML